MPRSKTTVLSRFFDDNTLLVAGTCSRCHRESTDVKIVAVNRRFLRQVEQRRKASGTVADIVTCGHRPFSKLESENENDACGLQPSGNLCELGRDDNKDETKPINQLKSPISNDAEEKTIIKSEPQLSSSPMEKANQNFAKSETRNEGKDYSKYFCRNLLNDKSTKVETCLSFVPVWHPPKSPHNLIEEGLYADPWALLVATIFLNKTSCATARPYIEWFLSDFHNPFEVLEREPADLEKYFVAIGLKKRAHQVWRMSHDFVHKDWKDVKELHGIGSYGRDAFNMFCLGRMHVEPKDRFLRIYKAWFDLLKKDKRITEEEVKEDESEDSGFGCSPQDGDINQ